MRKSLGLITVALSLGAAPGFADGDPEEGEAVFRKCKTCHQVGEGAANRVGPALNGIVGALAGQSPDYRYSDALMEAAEGGLTWDEESLGSYLANPKELIPGTKMSFAGLRKEDDIENVIAYLATFE